MAGVLKTIISAAVESSLGRHQTPGDKTSGSLTDDDDVSEAETDQHDTLQIGRNDDNQKQPEAGSMLSSASSQENILVERIQSAVQWPQRLEYSDMSFPLRDWGVKEDVEPGMSVIQLDPRICQSCIEVLQPARVRLKGLPQRIVSYDDLTDTALKGCLICKAFLHRLQEKFPYMDVSPEGLKFSINKEQPDGKGSPPCLKLSVQTIRAGGSFRMADFSNTVVCLCFLPESNDTDVLPRKTASSTRSESSIDTARSWLKACLDHRECQTYSYTPTRLIEIGSSTDSSGFPSLRLRNGVHLPNHPEYFTLSHCWGGNLPVKLMSNNVVDWQVEIARDTLPRSFQDAIEITHRLGFRYIWIDALCVIQDSVKDWEIESAQMDKVYTSSHLNISATSAKDSSEGLFRGRDTSIVTRVRVALGIKAGCKEGTYFMFDQDTFEAEVNEAPLNTRAWVLQERLLSPRNLHFSSTQLFWDCCKITACELFPSALPSKMRGVDKKKRLSMALNARRTWSHPSKRVTNEDMHTLWANMVQMYCCSQLTVSTDRLVALSGLASNFAASLRAQGLFTSRYIAGLWDHEIPSQLLWKLESNHSSSNQMKPALPPEAEGKGKERMTDAPLSPQNQYIAPSWSWASYEADFEYLWKPPYNGFQGISQDVVIVEEAWIKLVNNNMPFGHVSNGYLKIKGKLAEASYSRLHARQTDFWNKSVSMSWDFDTKERDLRFRNSANIYFLPVRAKAKDKQVLINIVRKLGVYNKDKTSAFMPEVDYKGGYLEGLIISNVQSASASPNTLSDKHPDLERYWRVGKWETLAVESFLRYVAAHDRIRAGREDENHKSDMDNLYPTFEFLLF